MKPYDLTKSYEFEGHWWIAGTSTKFPGKLTLSPEEVKLRIFGSSDESASLENYDIDKPPIFGQSVNGILFTLASAFCSGHSSSYSAGQPENYTTANILSNYCFIGKHVAFPDNVVDADYYISFPHLEAWFGYNPYKTFQKAKNETKVIKKLHIHDAGHLLDVELPSLETKLQSFHVVSSGGGEFYKQFKSECTAYLILQSGHKISAIKAMDFAYSISRLWSLLTGVYIVPRHVCLRKIHEEEKQPRLDEIEIYTPLGKDVYLDKVHPAEILLNFETLKSNIGNVIDKWFADSDRMSALRALFFKAFRTHRKRYYEIPQFLNYMTVLESIGRDYEPEKLLSNEEAKPLRKALVEVVKKFVKNKGIQDRIIQRLSYYHVPTLKEDLEMISDSLSSKTRNKFSLLDDKMLKKLVKTRNFYTHYGNVKLDQIIPDGDLPKTIDQLGVLVMLILLRELGIDEELIMKRFSKIWDYSFVF